MENNDVKIDGGLLVDVTINDKYFDALSALSNTEQQTVGKAMAILAKLSSLTSIPEVTEMDRKVLAEASLISQRVAALGGYALFTPQEIQMLRHVPMGLDIQAAAQIVDRSFQGRITGGLLLGAKSQKQ